MKIKINRVRNPQDDDDDALDLGSYVILDRDGTIEDSIELFAVKVRLFGFCRHSTFKYIDLDQQTFFDNPMLAVGKYAIFKDISVPEGDVSIDDHRIGTIEMIED